MAELGFHEHKKGDRAVAVSLFMLSCGAYFVPKEMPMFLAMVIIW